MTILHAATAVPARDHEPAVVIPTRLIERGSTRRQIAPREHRRQA